MNKKIIVLIILGIIILAVIVLIPSKKGKVNTPETIGKNTETISPVVYKIEIDEKGFSPKKIKGQIGSFIEFVNKSKLTVRIEFLDDAPGFQNLNLEPNGISRSTMFNQIGIYKYKNADDPDKQGQIEIK